MTEKVKYRDLFPRKNYKVLVYTEEEFVAAVLAEREACAKVCNQYAAAAFIDYPEDRSLSFASNECAAAIRARGEK
jgi:hypothetical protein